MLASQNFGYLKAHDAQLAQLGALAERYFRDDPATCLVKLRQLAELLAKLIAARHALFEERSSFDDVLRRLSFERSCPARPGRFSIASRSSAMPRCTKRLERTPMR